MKSSSSKKHEKGQGLVEYALILVLVAIVVIGTLTILGPSIGNVFSSINNSITTAGGGSGDGGSGGGDVCADAVKEICNGGAEQVICNGVLYQC